MHLNTISQKSKKYLLDSRNRTRVCQKILICLCAIAMVLPVVSHSQNIVIRVTDEAALARLKPDPGSDVLKQFPLGAQLEAAARAGDWYEISFTNEDGYTITAYIHSSSVEVIREEVAPPPVAYAEAAPMDTPLVSDQAGAILNGLFLKFGVMDKGTGDWIGSLGYSFRLHRNISISLEVMPSYISLKNDSIDLEQKTIHVFTLANVRAGTSLYFIDPGMDFFKFYAGFGGGMALSFTDTSLEGSSSTLFKSKPALQILGGIELDAGKVSLLFEYQMLRVLDKNVDPGSWAGYLIFGIRL